ncbi:PAS-domain containing protein [Roseovarius sp. A-2]|uniref:PAS-domain containing protein n=1 Tax=Roseovarius sp. A-2 TaxID=1570360 RepID=UPI0020CAF328|nr:PAS-domain containing protein [Roseovarius sp. A-2]
MEIATLLAGAMLVSLAVIWLVGRLPGPAPSQAELPAAPECHFLFRGATLIDHDAGVLWPDDSNAPNDDWSRFRSWLGFRFGDLPVDPLSITTGESLTFDSTLPDDPARLELHASAHSLRATLQEGGPSCPAHLHEGRRRLMVLDVPRAALHAAPQPVWIHGTSGHLIWQNDAARAFRPESIARMTAALSPLPEPTEARTQRVSVPDANGNAPDRWFDLTVTRTQAGHAFYACDVSALVSAETAQRDFVQTLGRTFADLPTGLAVFDHAKSLALFNPALIDLTGLPVGFLSARPNVMSFFDMLRDAQVMPEPKNYANWRSQINDMVSAARGGLYQDYWSLVSGQTYRITGRPHPNGAVAFLFEDITPEISEARNHRTEMDLRQAVIDDLDAAIAVLSPDHRLIFCNAGFGALLGIDPDSSIAEATLRDIIAACQARFPQTNAWPGLERKIATGAAATQSITLADGAGRLDLRHTPLGRGNTMLSLCHHAAEGAALMHEHTG